ncbi:hypothetical protein AJ78_00153 [Emergomyces pasteurianus Ep9510]|uniref:Uncharacterized protein n=1 Tax=Emergomyces pasteurianus Ep9510 TaxID=1447872 RepID=A0A1J9QUS5_9EURO|nr:hypothetical protein AJ78_00153 [Emergomyces pasteurianus Ep9510]
MPRSVRVPLDQLDILLDCKLHQQLNYSISKAGNYLYTVKFEKWYRAGGVLSVALNPGSFASDLSRHWGKRAQFPPANTGG